MITVTLENEGNMLRTELPKPLEDLFDDLGSIGITEPMNNITLSKDSPYNIRLYSDSILGQAVIERLTERDDLSSLNDLCSQLYKGFDDTFKADIINESNARGIQDLRTLFGTDIPLDRNKFTIKAQLDYAPSQLFPSRCVVEKTVPITHEDFMHLMNAPMKPNAVIKENIDKMFYDHSDDTEHCLLLIDMQTGDGILIQSEGNDFAKQAQYIPNADKLYDDFRQDHAKEVKFYCPLKVVWDMDYEDNEVYPEDAADYYDNIKQALAEDEMPEERDRGLMYWYHDQGDGVDDKVYSARMDIEVYEGELVGVITAKIVGDLTDDEMRTFKDYITGQLSDGAGEGFEQRPISTSGGDILVSFWNGDNDCWQLIHEDEFDGEFPEPDEDIDDNIIMGGM